ncbi:MAG: branched-chain amino acid aminotransferase [Alphaproteobacteria bacterium]|nr:branched-chain amino acid aminotransferase [Alphaproteobacteria bacterium]
MTSWTYVDGEWQEGNVPLFGSLTHAVWLSSVVFDGARAFDGLVPDLDRHSERTIRSAETMGLKPTHKAEEIHALSKEGVRRFSPGAELYIRPMFFGQEGFVVPDPDSTKFALVLTERPLPEDKGFTACLSSFRRPAAESAPTDAKASCLYPNVARALREATGRGFDNAVKLDMTGNVAEFATANLFMVKDGVAHTPSANGTFLNGITRQRIIRLLQDSGTEVVERTITWPEILDADELFSTGNYAKVTACKQIEDRPLQPGPTAKKARELYFEFSRSQPVD